jgi:hypothetical protein
MKKKVFIYHTLYFRSMSHTNLNKTNFRKIHNNINLQKRNKKHKNYLNFQNLHL